jgi:ribosomal protein S18 acetylase RimI-like enzyme
VDHLASLRPSCPDDEAFFFDVVESTMKSHVVSSWGAWDEARVRAESVEFGRTRNGEVIERGGERIGILLLRPEPEWLYVRLLCLISTAQRAGIGSDIMRIVFARASLLNVPVRLRVLSSNPARAFYAKLGLRVVETAPQFVYMQTAA